LLLSLIVLKESVFFILQAHNIMLKSDGGAKGKGFIAKVGLLQGYMKLVLSIRLVHSPLHLKHD